MSDANPKQHDTASANTSRHLRRTVHLLLVVAGLTLLTLIYIPLNVWSQSDSRLTGVAVLKPGIDSVIWYVTGACTLVMLFVSTLCWKKQLRWQYGVCLAIGFLAFPLAATSRLAASVAPWNVYSTCNGPDGQTYTFMVSSFMQGKTMALGKTAPDGLLYKNFDILGDTNFDSPRSYSLVIRPVDLVSSNDGQLLLTDSGMMLGLLHRNRCYFAYDFPTKRFIGHGDIESLSPFLLLRADSRLVRSDVDSLFTHRDVPAVDGLGMLPDRQALLNAEDHDNAEVRRIARQLLARDDTE